MSSLIAQITSSGYFAPLTLTQDVLLCLFSSLFLSFPDSQTHKHTHKSTIFYINFISSHQLSCHTEFKYPSDNRLQSTETTYVYSPELKLLVSFSLLKPSDSPIHHFPPVSWENSPFLPNKEANKRKWLMHAPCWLDEGSFSDALRLHAPTTGCNPGNEWQSILFIGLF